MPRPMRTRSVSAAQVRVYAKTANEFAEAASRELAAERHIAATSLAVHAAINAADAVCGARLTGPTITPTRPGRRPVLGATRVVGMSRGRLAPRTPIAEDHFFGP